MGVMIEYQSACFEMHSEKNWAIASRPAFLDIGITGQTSTGRGASYRYVEASAWSDSGLF
jgi:hypothetical protein